MLEQAGNNKTVVITIFHIFKKQKHGRYKNPIQTSRNETTMSNLKKCRVSTI